MRRLRLSFPVCGTPTAKTVPVSIDAAGETDEICLVLDADQRCGTSASLGTFFSELAQPFRFECGEPHIRNLSE